MREALHIFLKDSRQQRVAIALTLAGTALLIGTTAFGFRLYEAKTAPGKYAGILLIAQYLPIALCLGWSLLIAQAVHADALFGDRQFWLTRPYSRVCLLAGKLLFALAYVSAPVATAQAAIPILVGLPLSSFIGPWLWSQVLVLALLVGPMLAIASTTASVGWLVASLIPIPFAVSYVVTDGLRFVGLDWIRYSVAGAVAPAVAGVVLWLQYGRRSTRLSQLTLLLGVLGAMGASSLMDWETAFTIQQKVTGKQGPGMSASLVPPVALPFSVPLDPGQFQLRFAIGGAPAEALISCESAQLTVINAAGAQFRQPVRTVNGGRLTSIADGCATFVILPKSAQSLADGRVTLEGNVYVAVFNAGQTTPLPMDTRREVPHYGACVASTRRIFAPVPPDRVVDVMCDLAFRPAAVATVIHAGQMSTSPYRPSYSPWPATLQLQPVERNRMDFRTADATAAATTYGVAAYARLPVHVVNVDLKAFAVAQPCAALPCR